jgi:hypothetical protein
MTSWRRITLLAKVADESRPVWRKSKCNSWRIGQINRKNEGLLPGSQVTFFGSTILMKLPQIAWPPDRFDGSNDSKQSANNT